VLSAVRRSLTTSLYISIAENFNTNALSSCCKKRHAYQFTIQNKEEF